MIIRHGFEVFENEPGKWLIVEIDGDYVEEFPSQSDALAELELISIPEPAETFARDPRTWA